MSCHQCMWFKCSSLHRGDMKFVIGRARGSVCHKVRRHWGRAWWSIFSIYVPLMLLVFWSHVLDPWRVYLHSVQCASHSDPKSSSLETQIWFCPCPISVRFFYFSISLRSQTLFLPFGDNLYFSKYMIQNAYISSHNIKLKLQSCILIIAFL